MPQKVRSDKFIVKAFESETKINAFNEGCLVVQVKCGMSNSDVTAKVSLFFGIKMI